MGKAELKLEIDADLLKVAKAAGVPLDQALEAGLRMALGEDTMGIGANAFRQQADAQGAEIRARQWAEENADAIRAYNERIVRRGVFGADLRRW